MPTGRIAAAGWLAGKRQESLQAFLPAVRSLARLSGPLLPPLHGRRHSRAPATTTADTPTTAAEHPYPSPRYGLAALKQAAASWACEPSSTLVCPEEPNSAATTTAVTREPRRLTQTGPQGRGAVGFGDFG